MSREDAVKTLARAGKGALVNEVYARYASPAQARYEQIRDEEYQPQRERTMLAKAYVAVAAKVTEELEREANRVSSSDRDDAARVFGTAGISGDHASLTISRRDAGDRAAQAMNSDELIELLRRATRSGDEVLARAIAQRATEAGYSSVMSAFLADRPALDAAAQRLWDAEQRSSSGGFGSALGLLSLRPPELAGMQSYEIETLANDTASSPSSDRASDRAHAASIFG